MAEAKKTTIPVTTYEEGMVLHLSMAEVRTLFALTLRVGGSPLTSPRKHVQSLQIALSEAMGKDHYDWDWANPEWEAFRDGPGVIAREYPGDTTNTEDEVF